METPNVFTLFPKLPQELRLKIWRSCIEPRVVRLDVAGEGEQSSLITPDNPAVLSVSHESREEALKTYQPCFGSTFASRSVVYANLGLDTVSLNWAKFSPLNIQARALMPQDSCEGVKFMTMSKSEFVTGLRDRVTSFLDEFCELAELRVSGCGEAPQTSTPARDIIADKIKEYILPAGPNERSESVPWLVCLDGGYQCLDHWWFKESNEYCPRRIGTGLGREKPGWATIVHEIGRECEFIILEE